ncbi:hypothetical protein JCM3766R1_003303, partial [Sporobolomyces carnicolor]
LFLRLPAIESVKFRSAPGAIGSDDDDDADTTTVFTNRDGSLRDDRPALLVTSTSHTPDEDLDVLLRALELYELEAIKAASNDDGDDSTTTTRDESNSRRRRRLPRVVVLVTGKGAGKDAFERSVDRLERRGTLGTHVCVRTAWLDLEDYPRLLGASDVGVSLHESTSGFDLPMKVVDMFGCDLPVLALDFES